MSRGLGYVVSEEGPIGFNGTMVLFLPFPYAQGPGCMTDL